MPSDGAFVFTDPAHLERVIRSWSTIRDDIERNELDLRAAARLVEPPARDRPSAGQAAAYQRSLELAARHSAAMAAFASAYLDRLTASRDRYAVADEDAGWWFRQLDQR